MQHTDITRGFFTLAQNTPDTDYIRLAYGLALSLKHSQQSITQLSIGVTPGTFVDPKYSWAFDKIVEIPWGDSAVDSSWKLENEWKAIWMSPYDETIKLDCDMLFLSDITSWWQNLSYARTDVVFANNVRDWKGDVINNDFYRKTFTANTLPNIYTAFTYFRKTDDSYGFFDLAKLITDNWQRFFNKFLEPITRPAYFSTDVAFALAMKIVDLDQAATAPRILPTFTHMKSKLQGWNVQGISDDWRDHVKPFFTPDGELKIGNHRQIYPLHYNIKDFLTDDILGIYEKLVKP